MEADSAKAFFIRELRGALSHLYDPAALRKSPLAELFDVAQREDTVSALRHILTDAIESLKPNNDMPPGTKAWYIYRILYYRYTEQFTQREVATDLALSIRQLRRHEKTALQVLADHLWCRYNLEDKVQALDTAFAQSIDKGVPNDAEIPSREKELEWLKKSIPSERVEVEKLVQGVLKIITPLAQVSGINIRCNLPDNLYPAIVQLTSMRQALLSILTALIHSVPRGKITIEAQNISSDVCISIRTQSAFGNQIPISSKDTKSLEMARQLIHLSEGSLEVSPSIKSGEPFAVKIMLPAAEQISVLVIDDNADTLQLIQRYLSGSRYRFIGTPDPEEALALAERSNPQIIVLDVMLPGIDGWELLGRLREYPATRNVPIIVCTILPQEQLALTLGAAEFIQKPFNRQTLLAALDRQFEPPSKESA